ncbi:tyrosine-protein phosphatase [Hyphomicrobium sp.]|uniref:tyrosine-protein phosphatase n=1 Tax=Hyphomicrobium sp. TaxID=82 RepID=UPI002D7836CB|nr:CpsB/CapC family capsule biosynthesis tyrosine phosphatase [Hyphomicrobium sp.]HET6389285.1 CpsB/CapC family capsule biosynthesis tyrosine phosphatase [Hyphomicrobium sp.]
MIDVHCHILPGIDDGAPDIRASLRMASALIDDGVEAVVCTPHILPGLYHNTGPLIRAATEELRSALAAAGVHLSLFSGADAHICPDFGAKLKSGEILTLADSRYVLLELPMHVRPEPLTKFVFELMVAGYVPIISHPERLAWIEPHFSLIRRLARSGVWFQVTSGSLLGAFGRSAKYWAERLLDEGFVHLLATDAHDLERRAPDLKRGRDAAASRVGDVEANHLVFTRPQGILANTSPSNLPLSLAQHANEIPKSA